MQQPGRGRLFIGFIIMAFGSLWHPQETAEILAFGLKERQRLQKKRHFNRRFRPQNKV